MNRHVIAGHRCVYVYEGGGKQEIVEGTDSGSGDSGLVKRIVAKLLKVTGFEHAHTSEDEQDYKASSSFVNIRTE